jgi:hypothetical protein
VVTLHGLALPKLLGAAYGAELRAIHRHPRLNHSTDMIGRNQIIQRRWKQRLLPARFTLNVGQEKCPRFRKGIFPSFACEKLLEFRNGLASGAFWNFRDTQGVAAQNYFG